MILLLANDEPESVMATGGNYLHQQIADVTTTHPELRSGIDNRPHGKKSSRRLGV
jgi:UDP-2-acetamido-3-amino-2,3-dideoxy-glucuronate N-acetyltransferase